MLDRKRWWNIFLCCLEWRFLGKNWGGDRLLSLSNNLNLIIDNKVYYWTYRIFTFFSIPPCKKWRNEYLAAPEKLASVSYCMSISNWTTIISNCFCKSKTVTEQEPLFIKWTTWVVSRLKNWRFSNEDLNEM